MHDVPTSLVLRKEVIKPESQRGVDKRVLKMIQEYGIKTIDDLPPLQMQLIRKYIEALIILQHKRTAVYDEEGGFRGSLPYNVMTLAISTRLTVDCKLVLDYWKLEVETAWRCAILEETHAVPLDNLTDIQILSDQLDCIMSWSKKDMQT